MSWGISATSKARDEMQNALQENFDKTFAEVEPADGVQEQYELARHVVDTMLDHLHVGGNDMVNSVSMNGHAKQAENESNSIGVYISVP